jgi:hypothetical protein
MCDQTHMDYRNTICQSLFLDKFRKALSNRAVRSALTARHHRRLATGAHEGDAHPLRITKAGLCRCGRPEPADGETLRLMARNTKMMMGQRAAEAKEAVARLSRYAVSP